MEIGRQLGISNTNIPGHLKKKHHHEIDDKIKQAKNLAEEIGQKQSLTKTEFQRQYKKEFRILQQYKNEWLENEAPFR